jgi:hypothetical protein
MTVNLSLIVWSHRRFFSSRKEGQVVVGVCAGDNFRSID